MNQFHGLSRSCCCCCCCCCVQNHRNQCCHLLMRYRPSLTQVTMIGIKLFHWSLLLPAAGLARAPLPELCKNFTRISHRHQPTLYNMLSVQTNVCDVMSTIYKYLGAWHRGIVFCCWRWCWCSGTASLDIDINWWWRDTGHGGEQQCLSSLYSYPTLARIKPCMLKSRVDIYSI